MVRLVTDWIGVWEQYLGDWCFRFKNSRVVNLGRIRIGFDSVNI